MRIKKTFQGNLPENTVVNTQSNSQTNTYSCEYANEHFGGVVLWTNPSPTSPFSAQTININGLSNYKCIEIYYLVYTGNPKQEYQKYYYNSTYNTGELTSVFTHGNRGYIGSRKFTVSSSGITFDNNYDYWRAGTTDSFQLNEDNNWTLPYKIIGYK